MTAEASPPGPAPEDMEELTDRLADVLAQWWESETGEATYAHQWAGSAGRVVRDGPDRSFS